MLFGAALRWTAEEDAALARAVARYRGAPDKNCLTGIRWSEIARRAPHEFPVLMRHLTHTKHGKTLARRWCQYVCPADQLNKKRRWR